MADDPLNPLYESHRQADAEFQPFADVQIVSTFGQPQAEYSAIRKGCALIDFPQRGILKVLGKDRLDFLNRFLTNQLVAREGSQPIAPGSGIYAFLLNNKGRIVADMNVLERGDHTLLETDLRNIPQIRPALEKFVFSEDVRFEDCTGKFHQIALHGPKTQDVLNEIAPESGQLPPLGSAPLRLLDTDAIIWRDDPAGVPGYFLIFPATAAGKIWSRLLSGFSTPPPDQTQPAKRRIWPTGWAAFNTTRIEAGRPLFGIDFDDTVLPAETGQLPRAVSFTKGCYLGQEIVARMHARGQIARLIVGIRMSDDALPIAASPVCDQERNQVGVITSSTMSPILSNSAICLAMVKKQFAALGTALLIPAEGTIRQGVVVDLPFLKPSEKDGRDND
jgi:aminomethyltransferase